MNSTPAFQELPFGKQPNYCCKVLSINSNEIVAVPSATWEGPLSKYNTITHCWTEFTDVEWPMRHLINDAVFDFESNQLFFRAGTKIFVVDFETSKVALFVDCREDYGWGCRIRMMIKDGLNIFALDGDQRRNMWHAVFDKTDGTKLSEKPMKLKSLFFGIYDQFFFSSKYLGSCIAEHSSSRLCELSSDHESARWTTLQWYDSRSPLSDRSVCITQNQRYLIVVGGKYSTHGYTDRIAVIDLKKRTHRESAVRCPAKIRFHTAMLHDQRRDDLLTHGFVRRVFKMPSFRSIGSIPPELTNVITRLSHNEYLHLITKNSADHPGHWRIRVVDILEN